MSTRLDALLDLVHQEIRHNLAILNTYLTMHIVILHDQIQNDVTDGEVRNAMLVLVIGTPLMQ